QDDRVKRDQQKDDNHERENTEILSNHQFWDGDRRGHQKFIRPHLFFFGKQSHRQDGEEHKEEEGDICQKWPDDALREFARFLSHRSSLRNGLHVNVQKNVKENAAEQHEQSHHDISHRGGKVLLEFFSGDGKNRSHVYSAALDELSASDTSEPDFSRCCSAVVSCTNTSSRVNAMGRSSSKPALSRTMSSEIDSRTSSFCLDSIVYVPGPSDWIFRTPGTCSIFVTSSSEGRRTMTV